MFERLINAEVYQCKDCKARPVVRRWDCWYWLSTVARCPRCGRADLKKRTQRDQIDSMNGNPLRLLQRWLGAPLLHCYACRLQFYDLRSLGEPARRTSRV